MGNTAEVAGLSRGINMENMEKGEEMLAKGRNFTWSIILFEKQRTSPMPYDLHGRFCNAESWYKGLWLHI